MQTSEYNVAVSRQRRDDAPSDWLQRLGAIDGVSVLGSSSGRAQIRADEQGLQRLRVSLGEYLRIEPVIAHQVQ